jgi:NAD-dependent SIR2 family protein deacetylase
MTGRWRINLKGNAIAGGSLGYFTCSECGMTFAATNLPLDQLGGSPKWCPNCGSDNRERERDYYTRAEIIMQKMKGKSNGSLRQQRIE